METRKGLPITEFTVGQILTRLDKADFTAQEFNELLGITQTVTKFQDGSYRGEPLKYLGIENNMIYMERLSGDGKGQTIDLELENGWIEGWGIWIDPEFLKKK